ncbi:hypothetical protein [Novosphingobium cyanobacteriorum]|uniref:SnoaL-like domain-containing protein n=1 Tax=Novosphingobium cyanobacteriorum TaxID=3024215 RepID=A0ABT6CL53_9SPHN|nr:hypothetical protein [Novosphingobium cyanobacteriorum]MDF8333810.1 hypothetical protein [Novosphingobium cyanobacteriorum]
MAWDLKQLTLAADTALQRLQDPHHRRIVENYRLHAMLEVSGRWSEIFTPELTVEHPFYRVAQPGGVIELDGAEQVSTFYKALSESETTVMILTGEELVVDDWGFASEAVYNTFVTGEQAIARGHATADPSRKYVEHRWVCMVWPYDARGRMIGERVYPAPTATLSECSEENFLTVADARRVFDPLIAQAQEALRAETAQ